MVNYHEMDMETRERAKTEKCEDLHAYARGGQRNDSDANPRATRGGNT